MKKIYNKLMSIIFSSSTPIQLLLVSIFGFVFGFIPGFSYSPFLFVLVLFLVLVIRVNIGLFVLIAMLAKVISYPLEGVNFTIGRWFVDGFTQSIFKAAVNTPVLAYAGFDYYLVTGAFVVAIILGTIFGLFIGRAYKKFVSKMAGVQQGSELYQKLTSKLSVKIVSKVVFGKNISKVNWQKIQAKKFLQPIRVWGAIVVILLVVAVIFSPGLLETTLVSNTIKQQLTKANGATVDYNSLQLSLTDAKLQIDGLGAADPNDLNKDRFYAQSISASIDVSGLLTKHISLKNVVVNGVSFDKVRNAKAELYLNSSNSDAVSSVSDNNTVNTKITKQQAIDGIKTVSEGLQQVDIKQITSNTERAVDVAKGIKQGVEFLSSFMSSDNSKEDVSKQDASDQAKVYGYANVRNENLQDKVPSFSIQNMDINGYKYESTVYDANITNLSTAPVLLGKPTKIDVKSTNNDNVDANVVISNKVGEDNTVRFNLNNVGGSSIKNLTIQNVNISSKNLSMSGSGTWQFSGIRNINFNIPLQLKYSDVEVKYNEFKQGISSLTLTAVLSGNLSKVNLGIDPSSLKNILSTAVTKESVTKLAKQAGLDKKAQELINNTRVNGKSLKDLNPNDVRDLASSFGVKI